MMPMADVRAQLKTHIREKKAEAEAELKHKKPDDKVPAIADG